MRRAVLLLVVLAVAGCSDAGSRGAAETATPGLLHGVVVDQAIRPLANASVSIALTDGTQRNATTGDDGLWSFTGLAPGDYLVRTLRAGYFAGQTQANVTAGIDDPPAVRIVLELNHTIVAGIDSYVFEGYLQCSATAVAVRQACNVDEAVRPICDPSPVPCGDNVTEDQFLAVHAIGRAGIAFLQSELQWDASSNLGESLRAVPGARDPASGTLQDFEGVEGPAPLVVPMSGEVANALGIAKGRDYAVRVFSSYNAGTAPPCLPSPAGCQWGVGVVFQQRFSMVTHVFYGFTPPEGWQFGRDGLPPVPA